MTTLLERIADMAACVGGNVEEVLVEAANEIEHLRAEVQTWKQQSELYLEKIEAMEQQKPVAQVGVHKTGGNADLRNPVDRATVSAHQGDERHDERKVLGEFITRYREFWLRQPLELYEAACAALQEHYDKMGKEAA